MKNRHVSSLCCNGEVLSYWATVVSERPAKRREGENEFMPLSLQSVRCDVRWKSARKMKGKVQKRVVGAAVSDGWNTERMSGWGWCGWSCQSGGREEEQRGASSLWQKSVSVKRGSWSQRSNAFSVCGCVLDLGKWFKMVENELSSVPSLITGVFFSVQWDSFFALCADATWNRTKRWT